MTHEWIPEAVRVIAETVEYGKPIGERLLALEAVWEQLARRAEELDDRRLLSKRLAALPRRWRVDTWGIDTLDVSLPAQALAAFYCGVVIELAHDNPPSTMSDVAASTRNYRIAAEQCRAALTEPGRPNMDENLANALAIATYFFEEKANLNESTSTVLAASPEAAERETTMPFEPRSWHSPKSIS